MYLIILKAWQQSAITKQKGGLFYQRADVVIQRKDPMYDADN